MKLSLRAATSTDTTVRAVTGRVASRYSLFDTTRKRLRSTVVNNWPKATCTFVAFERLHHAGRLLPFEHHLRTDLDFARRRRDDGLRAARRNGLAAALLAAFAAAPQLLHFAFDAGRLLRVDGIRLLDPLLEGVEIAPDEPRHFTLGLRLADLLDRLLDATVGLSH